MKDEDIKLPKMPSQYFCKPWHHDIEEYAREAVRLNMPDAATLWCAKSWKSLAPTLIELGLVARSHHPEVDVGALAANAIRKLAATDRPNQPAAQPLPFDLEKAKAGHPLVTRDGRKARFVAHAEDAVNYGVVVMVEGDCAVSTSTETGRFFQSGDPSACDLFLAPPEPQKMRKVWANYYPDGNVDCFKHKTDAEEYATSNATHVAVEIQIPDLG